MAQTSAKYLKISNLPVLVDFAKYDGAGNEITTTYVKNGTIASATALGLIKVGTGLEIAADGTLSVESAGKVKWSGVEGRPFNSVNSDDFTIEGTTDSDKVLKVNATKWATTKALEDGLALKLDEADFNATNIVSTLGTTPVNRATADASGNEIAATYETKTNVAAELAKKVDVTVYNEFIGTTAPATYVKISGFKTSYLDANNVAYKSDFDSYYTKTETDSKIDSEIKSQVLDKKGVANGFAELDANGTVPSSQLPSYVDDVLEYASKDKFPTTGETGKIYVAIDTNLTFRWSGTQYVEISASLALGETSSTAYAGDKGKQNADNISALTTRVSDLESSKQDKISLVAGEQALSFSDNVLSSVFSIEEVTIG